LPHGVREGFALWVGHFVMQDASVFIGIGTVTFQIGAIGPQFGGVKRAKAKGCRQDTANRGHFGPLVVLIRQRYAHQQGPQRQLRIGLWQRFWVWGAAGKESV